MPRYIGLDDTAPEADGSFGLESPAGLEIQNEVPTPEIATGARVASVAGGIMLVSFGLKKRSATRMAAAGLGAALLVQGLSGKRMKLVLRRWLGSTKPLVPIKIHESFTIFRARDEVFDIWRSLENLPHYMRHLADIERLDSTRSKWTFEVPGLKTQLQWTAELTVIEKDIRLAWRSLPGGDVATAGDVRFEDAPDGRGTILRVRLAYWPPAGRAGRGISYVFNPAFERLMREDLRRVKFFIEAEEIPTTLGKPIAAP